MVCVRESRCVASYGQVLGTDPNVLVRKCGDPEHIAPTDVAVMINSTGGVRNISSSRRGLLLKQLRAFGKAAL